MRIITVSTWLLTLATLAPTACALPDDGAEIAFRSSYGAAEAGDVNAGGQEGTIVEVPECIVVTTPTNSADDGDTPPGSTSIGVGDDFSYPGDGSTTGTSTGATSFGDEGDDGGDDRAPPPDGGDADDGRGSQYGGDGDMSGVPMDPNGVALCPGEGKKVTVQASSALSAARLCEQYYGHCCDAVCEDWELEPNESCALAPDDDEQIGGLLDVNPNPGTYTCGCDCIEGLVIDVNGT